MLKRLRSRLRNFRRASNYHNSANLGAEGQVDWLAKDVAKDWKNRPSYYDSAEKEMDSSWNELIWPMIKECDFSCVVDLAAGHGRNSAKLAPLASKLYVVDINEENVRFCQQRFANQKYVLCLQNDGLTLKPIADDTVTLVYCFDAMVHFDSDVVRSYIREIKRVLRPGGSAFIHHSNYTANPAGYFRDNPGWRNFMSKELFQHYCAKEGLSVVAARVIDWEVKEQDTLSLVRKLG